MPRGRDPNRDKAAEIYREHGGSITNRRIAELLGIDEKKIAVWKNRDKEDWGINDVQQPQRKVVRRTKSNKQKKQIQHKPPPKPSEDLTEKERIFVMEYLRDFNATRAAIAVGYSKKTAYAIGYELLRKPHVAAEVDRLKEIVVGETWLDIKRVIAETMKIAFADITDYISFRTDKVMVGIDEEDDEGRPLYSRQQIIEMKPSDEVDGTVISEVSLSAKGTFSFKLHNKLKALEKLERYLDFMTKAERARLQKVRAETEALKDKAW